MLCNNYSYQNLKDSLHVEDIIKEFIELLKANNMKHANKVLWSPCLWKKCYLNIS